MFVGVLCRFPSLTVFSFFHLCILPRMPEVTVSSPSEEGGWQRFGNGGQGRKGHLLSITRGNLNAN